MGFRLSKHHIGMTCSFVLWTSEVLQAHAGLEAACNYRRYLNCRLEVADFQALYAADTHLELATALTDSYYPV